MDKLKDWHFYITLILAAAVAAGGFFGYRAFEKTQKTLQETSRELAKTQDELLALKVQTQEAQVLEKQLQEKDEALKKSQVSQELLEKTIQNLEGEVKAVTISSKSLDPNFINEFAPAVVELYCRINSFTSNVRSGSGVLFKTSSSKIGYAPYYVQTNLHVVKTDDGSESACVIVVRPDFRDSGNVLLFHSKSYRFHRDDIDIAFVKPTILTNDARAGNEQHLQAYAWDESKSPICDPVDISDRLTVLGYPASGGKSLTVTDGIVSGFESMQGNKFIKTSAKVDTGNSGGIAIKDSGCIVGVPTYVQLGTAESIGRVLDLNYLYNVTLK